jgi:uncharacterized protein YgiM (DUF1202 family)
MKSLSIYLLLIAIPALLHTETLLWYNPGESLTVFIEAGLNLRDKPDINSKVIVRVPYGQKVTVLENTKKPVPFKFDNIDGHWVYAEYEGKKGYIFDGYLSTLPAPELSEDSQYPLLDYMHNLSESCGTPEQSEEGGEGQMTTIEKYYFDNKCTAEISVTYYWTDDPDFTQEVYTFPMVTRVEEGFILLKAFGYFSDDPKFVFPADSMKAKDNQLKFEIQKSANDLMMHNENIFIQITADKNGVKIDLRYQ